MNKDVAAIRQSHVAIRLLPQVHGNFEWLSLGLPKRSAK